MFYINLMIKGVPSPKRKSRGDLEAPKRWSEAIVKQTKDFPKIKDACVAKVTFLLPPDKFPGDLPYGPDLDNLLKCLLDALGQTVFSEARGGDSCIVSLFVMKTKVASHKESGAHLEIMPVKV